MWILAKSVYIVAGMKTAVLDYSVRGKHSVELQCYLQKLECCRVAELKAYNTDQVNILYSVVSSVLDLVRSGIL